MDARISKLEAIRARKAEAAQTAFMRARRNFAHAAHVVETLAQQRAQAEKTGHALESHEMAQLMHKPTQMSALAAVHEGAERRQAALLGMDAEITRATMQRETLRQAALEQQALFYQARKVAKKLELLAQALRSSEKSLQNRLSESRSDSVIKNQTTGRWQLLQTD